MLTIVGVSRRRISARSTSVWQGSYDETTLRAFDWFKLLSNCFVGAVSWWGCAIVGYITNLLLILLLLHHDFHSVRVLPCVTLHNLTKCHLSFYLPIGSRSPSIQSQKKWKAELVGISNQIHEFANLCRSPLANPPRIETWNLQTRTSS